MDLNNLPKGVIDAKAKGLKVYAVEGGGQVFYIRQPSKNELYQFQGAISRDHSSAPMAQEKLLRQLFAGDNTAEFAAYLEAKPLAHGAIFNRVTENLGLNETFTAAEV